MTDAAPPHQRRVRYAGTHPRSFAEKYKELDPLSHGEAIDKVMARGQTPAGMHRPICVAEILALLAPQPGEVGLDATLGYGGHARELLARLSPGGRLFGVDVDPAEFARTEARLRGLGFDASALVLHRINFDGVAALQGQYLQTTSELADLVRHTLDVALPARMPAAERKIETTKSLQRTFQALRIAVNDEFGVLERFLALLPACLKPGGRVVILSFHSGEDRRVKKAFQAGERSGIYARVAPDAVRPSAQERRDNPRSASTKLRWAVAAG